MPEGKLSLNFEREGHILNAYFILWKDGEEQGRQLIASVVARPLALNKTLTQRFRELVRDVMTISMNEAGHREIPIDISDWVDG